MNQSNQQSPYERIHQYLCEKDGRMHTIMLNNIIKSANSEFITCDINYTYQVNEIIARMQEDGYEILDIKFNTTYNPNSFSLAQVTKTMIVYR